MNTETITIELNQTNATSVSRGIDGEFTNGKYTCKIKEPVTLFDGDAISMRLATVDSNRGDSDTINIVEDTPLSIGFSYYDVDYPVTVDEKRVLDGSYPWLDAIHGVPYCTFEKCSGYMAQDILSLTSVKYKVHPDKEDVTVVVNPLFSWIDENGVHQANKGVDGPYHYVGEGGTGNDPVCVLRGSSVPIKFKSGSLKVLGSLSWEYKPPDSKNHFPTRTPIYLPDDDVVVVVSTGARNLLQRTAGMVLRKGKYNKSDLAYALTKGFSEVGLSNSLDSGGNTLILANTDLVLRTDEDRYEPLAFRINKTEVSDVTFSNNDTYVYKKETGTIKPKVLIGSRKFAIKFGVEGDVYQLDDNHTSFHIESKDPDGNDVNKGLEGVGIYQETVDVGGSPVLRNFTVNTTTGTLIHSMEPVPFWRDLLGLYTNLVVPLTTGTNGIHYWTRDNAAGKYPTESDAASIYSNSNNRVIEDPLSSDNNPIFIDTTSTPTNAVVGQSVQAINYGGYYKVRLSGLGLPLNKFINTDRTVFDVCAVLSLQYTSLNMTTAFGDSAIMKVHHGAPAVITQCGVDIEDPETDKTAFLGPKNCVILDITRRYRPTMDELKAMAKSVKQEKLM